MGFERSTAPPRVRLGLSSLFPFREMASKLPLPAELQGRIASYAAHRPTPSGVAIREHLDAHPWIDEMAAAYPMMHPGTFILGAPYLGLIDCSKCSSCMYASNYQIRRRYEPEE